MRKKGVWHDNQSQTTANQNICFSHCSDQKQTLDDVRIIETISKTETTVNRNIKYLMDKLICFATLYYITQNNFKYNKNQMYGNSSIYSTINRLEF